MKGAATSLRAVLVVAVLLSAQAQAQAQADDEVLSWLAKMDQAVRSLSYSGTFVYLHGSQLESMRVEHRVGAVEHERLTSLNGEPREVIRENDRVTCISSRDRMVTHEGHPMAHPGVPTLLPEEIDELGHYYAFHLDQEDRVADRRARVLTIRPKDQYRYGYRLSLDEESGLPLKTDLLDLSGEPVAQIMYTDLQLEPGESSGQGASPGSAASSVGGSGSTESDSAEEPARQPERSNWTFAGLPQGFELSAHEVRVATGDKPQEHFVLSDGLASVSVYVELAGPEHELAGPASMGALNAYGQRYGDHQVTVVGEVPALTVQTVAQALGRVAGGAGQ